MPAVAYGNAGASSESGPTSRTSRFAMPRAGRPVTHVGEHRRVVGRVGQRPAVQLRGRRLGGAQERGADLHRLGAQRQRGRDPAARRRSRRRRSPVRRPRRPPAAPAPSCRPGRPSRSVRNMPRWPPASTPCAITASQPCSTSHRASATVVAEESNRRARRAHPLHQRRRGQPEVEADHRRPQLLDELALLPVERRPAGAQAGGPGHPELRRSTPRAGRTTARRLGHRRSLSVAEEVQVERAVGAGADRGDLGADRSRSSSAHGSEPSPPAAATATASALPFDPPSAPGRSAPRSRAGRAGSPDGSWSTDRTPSRRAGGAANRNPGPRAPAAGAAPGRPARSGRSSAAGTRPSTHRSRGQPRSVPIGRWTTTASTARCITYTGSVRRPSHASGREPAVPESRTAAATPIGTPTRLSTRIVTLCRAPTSSRRSVSATYDASSASSGSRTSARRRSSCG